MKKEWEPRQSRATTHFKFYSEKYLWGSTRAELLPDERGVWIDFLCLATMNFGKIEVYSRDQLAQQLLISRELLDRSIEKFLKYGKIKRKYYKKEKKEVFSIINWARYQADYLTKRVKKSDSYKETNRAEKTEKYDTENKPTLKKRRGEENTLQETTSEEIKEDNLESRNNQNSNSLEVSPPLPSNCCISTDEEKTIKEEFLIRLKNCSGYPFNEIKDSVFFDCLATEYPGINILNQIDKKIAWWKKHPDALKRSANPRKKLEEWFKGEFEFQKRGGPQRIGKIMEEVKDQNHRHWLKQLIEKK